MPRRFIDKREMRGERIRLIRGPNRNRKGHLKFRSTNIHMLYCVDCDRNTLHKVNMSRIKCEKCDLRTVDPGQMDEMMKDMPTNEVVNNERSRSD